MTEKKMENGVSVFSRTTELLGEDPLEEIFALNLGDFLTEHLISEELAQKIKKHDANDKSDGLKKQLKELISIYSINNTLSVLGFSSKEDYVIYNSIAKTIVQMLDIEACHIFLAEEYAKGLKSEEQDIVLVGSSVDFDDDIYSFKIGCRIDDNNFLAEAFDNKKTIIIPARQVPDVLQKLAAGNLDNSEFIAIPMHNNAESVGVVLLQNPAAKPLSNEFVMLVKTTAKLFATSMLLQKLTEETGRTISDEVISSSELQHLRAELTATIGDLGEQQQQFVEMLAKAVDAKSQYSNNHSQEVANLAKELCNYLELNEKTKDLIYYAGLLQNIGKITLPADLFNKKGELSKEEWEKLQNHPNVGVSLLMSINFLSEVIPYIHYHKERWDGKGEPEGLKGHSIPLGSRIIALADAYCALTEERPYRPAMSKQKALEIISEEAEIKWDPVLVNSLVNLLNKE